MRLLIEAARSAVAQPVASIVTGLIVAGACAAILSTTGQTIQAEQQVLSQIDAAGTRSVVISDTQGTAGITKDAVDRVSRISGVEWVLGLGPATDVRAAGNPGGNPAAIRPIHGHLPTQITASGLRIDPGSALVGPQAQTTLGFETPVGGVTTDTSGLAVVGSFRAEDPLLFLNRSLITRPDPDDMSIRSVHILVETPDQVGQVTDAALMLIAAQDPTSIGIETSETLAQVRAAVQGELGRYGRQLITLVLGAGLILTGLNVYGTVTTRRRDFGRRRALGASRSTIITLIAVQTFLTAALGAITGSIITAALLQRLTNNATDLRFATAITILATFAASLAAIPPALIAAYRDPVRILRVP